MSFAMVGSAAIMGIGGLIANSSQSKANDQAAKVQQQATEAQAQATAAQTAENKRQYDLARTDTQSQLTAQQNLLSPFLQNATQGFAGLGTYGAQGSAALSPLAAYGAAGNQALQAQQNLLGMGGYDAYQAAVSGIEQSPEMAAMQRQGENALLQNASATGGLRGGNLQSSLAQFRPALLNQLIQERLSQYGGLAAAGQSAYGTLSQLGGQAYGNQAQLGSNLAALPGAAGTGQVAAQSQTQAPTVQQAANQGQTNPRMLGRTGTPFSWQTSSTGML
jgi:hypothetical protein